MKPVRYLDEVVHKLEDGRWIVADYWQGRWWPPTGHRAERLTDLLGVRVPTYATQAEAIEAARQWYRIVEVATEEDVRDHVIVCLGEESVIMHRDDAELFAQTDPEGIYIRRNARPEDLGEYKLIVDAAGMTETTPVSREGP